MSTIVTWCRFIRNVLQVLVQMTGIMLRVCKENELKQQWECSRKMGMFPQYFNYILFCAADCIRHFCYRTLPYEQNIACDLPDDCNCFSINSCYCCHRPERSAKKRSASQSNNR